MTKFKGTGVFATKEEGKRIMDAIDAYDRVPVIAYSTSHALDRGGVKGDSKESVHNMIDEIAISNGLLEYIGHYGFNPETLEFNKPI